MKPLIPLLALAVMNCMTGLSLQAAAPRETQALDDGWRFTTGEVTGAQEPAYDDRDWQEVRLPHDWAIAGPYNQAAGAAQGYLRRPQVGWYRLHLDLPTRPLGSRALIQFDGVYRESEVWINGVSLGKRPSGYISFYYDLTPHLRPQGNVIAVRVDNSGALADRWYSGAGIYRRVWLTTTGPVAVAPWEVTLTTPRAEADKAEVALRVTVENHEKKAAAVETLTEILDPAGAVVGRITAGGTIPAQGRAEWTGSTPVAKPQRWSPETPSLYTARTMLKRSDAVVDEVTTSFGIRSLQFTPERGFELNGQVTKMKGVCLHHDAGCLGAAFYVRAWERRLQALKQLGCNAIRTSHNPADPAFLDLCDRLGFLVLNEAFDKWMWESGWYTPFYQEWSQRDLADFVRRDRNHPSVVVWSVGNEVTEQRNLEAMDRFLPPLVSCVKKLDPTRPVTLALEPHCWPVELQGEPVAEKVRRTMSIAKYLDLLGVNYQEQWYDDYLKANPKLVIMGTENYGGYRKRRLTPSAYDDLNPWFDVESRPQVISQFLWTGIDYLGEAGHGWPVKGWTGALMDTTGHVKPRAYFHQSVWSAKPMVHAAVFSDKEPDQLESFPWSWLRLADHWTLQEPTGDQVRVVTYSNCEEVELIVNGKSYGRRCPANEPNRTLIWNVRWGPGKLVARGSNGGQQVAEHVLKTAGAPARIEVKADRPALLADGQDLCNVEVCVVDKEGTVVPSASNQIGFDVNGPVRLIGVDNGDLTSNEAYQTNRRKAFQGRCLAVLRAGKDTGEAELLVTAEGLPAQKIKISCRR